MKTADITVAAGSLQSEFAVVVDGTTVFSRLQERRYPEPDELVTLCRKLAQP